MRPEAPEPAAMRSPDEDFAAAYERLWPDAVRLGRLLTGSLPLAEDLAQDAFVAMQRNWAGVRNPDGYIRTAVVNRVRNHRRRPVAPFADAATERSIETGDPEMDETLALVLALDERPRAALVLRYYCDLPHAEIAEILGCRVGTVKSTIHRTLERPRRELR